MCTESLALEQQCGVRGRVTEGRVSVVVRDGLSEKVASPHRRFSKERASRVHMQESGFPVGGSSPCQSPEAPVEPWGGRGLSRVGAGGAGEEGKG